MVFDAKKRIGNQQLSAVVSALLPIIFMNFNKISGYSVYALANGNDAPNSCKGLELMYQKYLESIVQTQRIIFVYFS